MLYNKTDEYVKGYVKVHSFMGKFKLHVNNINNLLPTSPTLGQCSSAPDISAISTDTNVNPPASLLDVRSAEGRDSPQRVGGPSSRRLLLVLCAN